ncbi:MAG: hypothetical protein JW927_22375 [Deltaproteobacteria bacterium]|nr:hypothetical protein [Deltaproteobacteria bacterium]
MATIDKKGENMKHLLLFCTIIFMTCLLDKANGVDFPKIDVETIQIDSEIVKEMSSRIQELCDVTGMIYDKPIYKCEKNRVMNYTYYVCEAYLKYNNEDSIPYSIRFDKKRNLISFYPMKEKVYIEMHNHNYTYILDELKERQQALEKVNIVNAKLGLALGGKGIVEKSEKYYMVRFGMKPKYDIKEPQPEKGGHTVYIDQDITFYLTKDMTVFAVSLRGPGGALSQMEED